MEIGRILVVCTGNICRSPMAEAVLRKILKDSGITAEVTSAGIAAAVGYPAAEYAQSLMADRGVDIAKHRAVQLIPEMLIKTDLVLVMEKAQQQYVERMQPAAKGRVFRLGEWSESDIPDPYGHGKEVYNKVLNMIDSGVSDWLERIT